MERLLAALGKSKSKSKRDDAALHTNLAQVIINRNTCGADLASCRIFFFLCVLTLKQRAHTHIYQVNIHRNTFLFCISLRQRSHTAFISAVCRSSSPRSHRSPPPVPEAPCHPPAVIAFGFYREKSTALSCGSEMPVCWNAHGIARHCRRCRRHRLSLVSTVGFRWVFLPAAVYVAPVASSLA